MKKIVQKIKLRNQQFGNHPITKDNRMKAMTRYIVFNSLNRIKSNIKYDWIENLVFYASKGDGGIVANIYYGLYEFNESVFVLHYLRKDDTFLDVGQMLAITHFFLLELKNVNQFQLNQYQKLLQD